MPPYVGCYVVSVQCAMEPVADAIDFAFALAISNWFSFLHGTTLARGVGHPLSYPLGQANIYFVGFQVVANKTPFLANFCGTKVAKKGRGARGDGEYKYYNIKN